MANFNRENRSGGNRNFGKPRFNRARPDMHKATCATCGKICEVPFKPNGSKPVYCKDCFQKSEGSDSQRSENRTFERPQSEDRQLFEAICANCGNTCQIPFRPSPGRDVFCSRCFEKKEGSDSRRPERRAFDRPSFQHNDSQRTTDTSNYKAQFESLNVKMDKILRLLTPTPIAVTPLESAIDKKVIGEIATEKQEDKGETAEKKSKKPKTLATKPTTKKTSKQKK